MRRTIDIPTESRRRGGSGTSPHPAAYSPAPSVAASLTTVAVALAVVLTISFPLPMAGAAVTAIAGFALGRFLGTRLSRPEIPLPGTGRGLRVGSTNECAPEADEPVSWSVCVAVVER